MGPGRRADPAAARRGRVRRLHSRQHAGLPVSILNRSPRPRPRILDDAEPLRERVATTATSLLGLARDRRRPAAEPRAHPALDDPRARVAQGARPRPRGADPADPDAARSTRVGVLDLESFFPAKERFALAMGSTTCSPRRASPPGSRASRSTWRAAAHGGGQAARRDLLHRPPRRRRAHVLRHAAAERDARLDARAVRHDQPARAPLHGRDLRLLPAGRESAVEAPAAHPAQAGARVRLGVVLATQNPVDLDYKGLSNTGTWFIGRLQTERDKARVLEGWRARPPAGDQSFDRAEMEQTLAGLGSRVFLLHNVHEDGPVIFETRWAMSYLRGPLTRAQIKKLMAGRRPAAAPRLPPRPRPPARPPRRPRRHARAGVLRGPRRSGQRATRPRSRRSPVLPARAGRGRRTARSFTAAVRARPGSASWTRKRASTRARSRAGDGHHDGAVPVSWEAAADATSPSPSSRRRPTGATEYAPIPRRRRAKSYEAWRKDLVSWLSASSAGAVPGSRLETLSRPGESERDFRIRLGRSAARSVTSGRRPCGRSTRRARPCSKSASAGRGRPWRGSSNRSAAGLQTVISVGATLLGAFFGRKTVSAASVGRATTAARGAGRV